MQIHLQRTVTTAVPPSPRVLRVAAMFGLGIDEEKSLAIVPPFTLTLQPGIIFITGPSGSGKSTIRRCIAETVLQSRPPRTHLLDFNDLPPLPQKPLVDALPDCTLEQTLAYLSLAGLSDAFVMLRTPAQLSDGQRYRMKLAQTMALAQQCDEQALIVVLADEFGATLDRITAAVIARNARKWVDRQSNICFIAATTHDDLLEHLDPDTLIEKPLDETLEIAEAPNR